MTDTLEYLLSVYTQQPPSQKRRITNSPFRREGKTMKIANDQTDKETQKVGPKKYQTAKIF